MAGGGYAFSVDPEDLEKGSYQAGIDFHGRSGWHGALDVKALEEQDYDTSTSFTIGYQFGDKGPTDRSVSLRLIAYDGITPFGQFFTEDISYVGAGVYFKF